MEPLSLLVLRRVGCTGSCFPVTVDVWMIKSSSGKVAFILCYVLRELGLDSKDGSIYHADSRRHDVG